jgi:hypothetical protein
MQAISAVAVAVAVILVRLDAPLTLLLCAAVPPVLPISRWSVRRAGANGTHDELLRRSGLYARLCREQLVAERAEG